MYVTVPVPNLHYRTVRYGTENIQIKPGFKFSRRLSIIPILIFVDLYFVFHLLILNSVFYFLNLHPIIPRRIASETSPHPTTHLVWRCLSVVFYNSII